MPGTDRKLQLFRALLGVRRAGRSYPDDPELATARLLLEEEIGTTVSGRLAARVLGLSHTALRRWIERGEIPTVYTESGTMQIPVNALLDLYESVSSERAAGRSHVLEPVARAAQTRADRLPVGLLSDVTDPDAEHRRAHLRGLAYHRALASRLTAEMIADARQVLTGWQLEGRIDPEYAARWHELLVKPVHEVQRELAADSPQMADLRQNSPFAGTLSERERRVVLAATETL